MRHQGGEHRMRHIRTTSEDAEVALRRRRKCRSPTRSPSAEKVILSLSPALPICTDFFSFLYLLFL